MFAWVRRLDHVFPVRYWAWALCFVGLAASTFAWLQMGMDAWLAIAFLCLCAIGIRDLVQKRHAVLRNYPVIGHLRFLLEFIRPEMRQYFIESDSAANSSAATAGQGPGCQASSAMLAASAASHSANVV